MDDEHIAHQLYQEQAQAQLRMFQAQQAQLEQDEYRAYFRTVQQSPPMFSPGGHYSHIHSSQTYLTYATDNPLNKALALTENDMLCEYGQEMLMPPTPLDSWKELAEWYWNLYNGHEGLLDPSSMVERGRQSSWDSSDSPNAPIAVAAEEKKPDLPEKPFRDQLIELYFVHVHPLTPVFDEHEFRKAYGASDDGLSVLDVVTVLEFQSMLFGGALHLNSTQLKDTNYAGTHECHKALFRAAKNTYHAHQHECRIASTRAAILLSLWAPYNTDHSNSYWVDQALANAQAANLHDLNSPSQIPTGRRKLIWMSCLRRDRYLACASRRSPRLQASSFPIFQITREDYGVEALEPRFMSLVAKWAAIENFQQQIELSQIMLRLLKFQKSRGFGKGKEWAKGVDMPQLLEARGIHSQMRAWRMGVEWPFLEGRVMGIGNCDAVIRLTAIQYESAIAFLYLPYIYVRPGVKTAITKEFSDLALQEVKKACSNIAQTAEVFVDAANSNDIPLSLGAWILLPIVLKLVFLWHSPIPSTPSRQGSTSHNSTQSHSRQSSATSFHPPPDPPTDLHEMRTLMTLLYIIKNRYSGGEFISAVLDTVMTHLQEERVRGNGEEALSLLQESAEVIDRALASRIVVGMGREYLEDHKG